MTVMPFLLLLLISFLLEKTNGLHKTFYSTRTPYKPPSSALVLPSPPIGFELVCAQILVRHGCRTIDDRHFHKLTRALWTKAKEEDALTQFGRQLREDLRYFIAVNEKIGFNELTGLGRMEHQGLAHRLTKRLLPLFMQVLLKNPSQRISVVTSGKSRATESLNAFVEVLPIIIAALIDYEPANAKLLSFADDSEYQTYIKTDIQLINKLQSIRMQPDSKQMARDVLKRLYKQSFIDKLANGYYSLIDNASGKTIKNEVDAALMLHALYLTGPNLREEGVGSLLEKYFHKDESAWFGYLHDAKEYYNKGPGISNQTLSYDGAQVLLDDFLIHSEKCSQIDSTHFLRVRFGQAGTIIPFAALLKIPILSDKSTPVNATYTYETNDWRGELVSPMTANIQWEIYRHYSYGKTRFSQHQQILIRMLYNEYPVPFKYECKPYNTINKFFYTLDELKRCYRRVDG